MHAVVSRHAYSALHHIAAVAYVPIYRIGFVNRHAGRPSMTPQHATPSSAIQGPRSGGCIQNRSIVLILAAGLLVCGPASAAGDAAAGKTAFETQCAACHTTTVGKNGFGPSLAQVIGRKAGGLAGYGYSPAMAQAGLTWDEKTLDHFLTSSSAAVPGTAMSVMVGNAADRANIIAYLDTLGRAAPVAAAAGAQAAAQVVLAKGPTQQ